LGYAYFKLKRSQEAISAYQEAIRLKPDYGTAYLGLGDTFYYQTKQYREALNAYRQGVRLKDDNATAYYNLAWSANELSEYAEAAAAAQRAISLQASYPEAYVERDTRSEAQLSRRSHLRISGSNSPETGVQIAYGTRRRFTSIPTAAVSDAVTAYQKTAAISRTTRRFVSGWAGVTTT
jgi:tetratricopeptide (TPR) repeat protein